MAARRLVVVMLVLLGVSTLAAILVQPPDEEDAEEEVAAAPAPRPQPRGELVRERIDAGDRSPAVISLRVGDQLALTVAAGRADEVEIPALGELRFAAPLAPARFDLLARQQGSYAIRLVEADRRIGRIEVAPRRRPRPGHGGRPSDP